MDDFITSVISPTITTKTPETPSDVNTSKRPNPESSQPQSSKQNPSSSSKRPRNNNKQKQQPVGRHNGASYSKQPIPSSLAITPIESTFPVYVGNEGIPLLADTCYNLMITRDHRLENRMPALKIAYIVNLAYALRLIQVAEKAGYLLGVRYSDLKHDIGNVLFPDFIAKYLECIGTVKLASGAIIGPVAGNYNIIFPPAHPRQVAPHSQLREAGIDRPDNPWSIHPQWILEYNQACARAVRTGLTFRTIRTEIEGRIEMAVSFVEEAGQRIAYAPEVMTEAVAELGAIYAFRRYGDSANWITHSDYNRLLWAPFTGRPFNAIVHANRLCLSSLLNER